MTDFRNRFSGQRLLYIHFYMMTYWRDWWAMSLRRRWFDYSIHFIQHRLVSIATMNALKMSSHMNIIRQALLELFFRWTSDEIRNFFLIFYRPIKLELIMIINNPKAMKYEPFLNFLNCSVFFSLLKKLESQTNQLKSFVGRDVCAGFGGAPLVIKENGVYLQIGIMSFGSDNCGGRNIPSVYTSIAHFIQWIRENSPNE